MTKNIHSYDRDSNNVVSEFTRCILQAANEAIPKGDRKEYKPYWNIDLDKLHNELDTASDIAEYVPTSANNTALKQVHANFIRARNDARRKSLMTKTADLNMEKDGKYIINSHHIAHTKPLLKHLELLKVEDMFSLKF